MEVYHTRCLYEGILCLLTFWISMVLIVSISRFFCCKKKKRKMNIWIRLFALITIYSNTWTQLFMSIGLIYSSSAEHLELNNKVYKIMHGISIISYSSGQTAIYLFFLLRCQSTFKNTEYASSGCTYTTLYALIIIYFLSQLSFVLFGHLFGANMFIVGTITSGGSTFVVWRDDGHHGPFDK